MRLTGVELQPAYADLARHNATHAGIPLEVIEADLRALPEDLRQRSFDHVILNPPYFDRARGTRSTDAGRDIAFGGDTPLSDWIDIATRRLAPKGWLTVIHRAEALGTLLPLIERGLGSVVLRPLSPRTGRDARLILLCARKGGRTALRLRAPWVLHDGVAHEQDADDYTMPTRAVLRDAAILPVAE